MGFLSASSSVVRFVAAAPARVEREAIAQAVTRHAFREAELGDPRYTSGWIAMHDPLLTTFTPADLFFHQYLVVGFRFDTRLVPPKLLMLERRRLERERAEARGVPWVSAAERKEIKEEIASRLIAQALPSPRLLEVVWNLESGRVYFSGKVRAAREAFAECFRRTFGVTPVPLIPYLAAEYVGLSEGAVQAVRGVEPVSLAATAPPPTYEPPVEPSAPPVESPREEELYE